MVRSLRVQIAEAKRLGIPVDGVYRSGEIRFLSLIEGVPDARVNARRKDGTPEVERIIRRHREVPPRGR